ncbi:MAG: peptide deformylase [Desulfobacterales bacterium]|nr:peptide deformylase [Desulfobacterales bacterium]
MTILDIITFPDKRLSQKSEDVEKIDEEIKKLIEDMADTMYDAPGVGLAAVQVGVLKNIVLIDETAGKEGNRDFMVLINPVIKEEDGSYLSEEEGCLSVPEYTADVKRYAKVKVEALDIDGNQITVENDEYLAIILQHEIDHLNGTLFIDRISKLKRELYKRKAIKKTKSEK